MCCQVWKSLWVTLWKCIGSHTGVFIHRQVAYWAVKFVNIQLNMSILAMRSIIKPSAARRVRYLDFSIKVIGKSFLWFQHFILFSQQPYHINIYKQSWAFMKITFKCITLLLLIVNTGSHCHTNWTGTEAGGTHDDWCVPPAHIGQSQWEGMPTKDAGNQRIAKSVQKGSTEIEYKLST